MQQMRNGADLPGRLIDQLAIISEQAQCVLRKRVARKSPHIHGDGRQDLADAVVQIARKTPAFLVLHVQKVAGEFAKSFVSFRKLSGAFLYLFFEVFLSGVEFGLDPTRALTDGDDDPGKEQESHHTKNI